MGNGERTTAPKFLEFFAGIGLVRLALEAEGASCVFANDISAEKCGSYRSNFGSGMLQECSIECLDPQRVPDADIAWASFPCTDITICGSRRGFDGPCSSMVWEFLRVISGLSASDRAPRVLLLENVLGMLSPSMIQGTIRLLERLCALGYEIDVLRIDAGWFTPQSRRRVFVLAHQPLSAGPRLHAEAALSRKFRGPLVRRLVEKSPSLAWGFLDLPRDLGARDSSTSISDIIADPPETDALWLDADRADRMISRLVRMPRDHMAMLKRYQSMRGTHYLSASESGRHGTLGGTGLFLRDDKVNCLLRPDGGNARRWVVRVRDGQVRVRPLSGVEYARLQGVGLRGAFGTFALPAQEAACKRAFADAICVPAVRWLYRHAVRPALCGSVTRVANARLADVLDHVHTNHEGLLRQSHLRRTIELVRGSLSSGHA
jgi:DNA (cytosine-5)-methyltransferase 1